MTDTSMLGGFDPEAQMGPETPEMEFMPEGMDEDIMGEVVDEMTEVVDELENLAEGMDAEKLTEIAETCIEEYLSDENDRGEWLEMHAKWIRLYHQNDRPLNKEEEWMSEDSLPLMAEACNQFAARAFKAFFPNRKVIKVIPVGNETSIDQQRADRVEKHMSWQLLIKDRGYKRNKRRLLLSTAVHGSHFTKTFYDPVKEKNCVVNVRAEDLVVPYGSGPRDVEDVERKTHILYRTKGWSRRMADAGFFVQEAEYWEDGDTRETTDAARRAEGLDPTQNSDEDSAREVKILEQHRYLDIGEGEKPYIVWVDEQSRTVLRIVNRYEIVDGREEPVEYFTHFPFIENPDGFYGLGMGHMIGSLNSSSNSLLRQIKDAGTLANIGNHSGFINNAIGPQGGEMRMQLGKFVKLQGADRMNDAIWTAKFPGPNAALGDILTMIMSRSDRLASATEMLSGQAEKVMQPTAVLALIEQGLEQFSSIYEGLFDAWGDELNKWYRLNSLYMDFEQYFTVLDAEDNPQIMSTGRMDYTRDFEVVPLADPKMSTQQQRLTRAQMEQQVMTQFYMMIAQLLGPQAVPLKALYTIQRRFLEATQVNDIEEVLMPPEQPPQQEPPRVDDPRTENMFALMPVGEDGRSKLPPVHAEQDHMMHLQEHEMVANDEAWGAQFPPGGKEALMQHIQQHKAYLYGMVEGNLGQQMRQGGGQGRAGGMAAQPGNPMVPAGNVSPFPGG